MNQRFTASLSLYSKRNALGNVSIFSVGQAEAATAVHALGCEDGEASAEQGLTVPRGVVGRADVVMQWTPD